MMMATNLNHQKTSLLAMNEIESLAPTWILQYSELQVTCQ